VCNNEGSQPGPKGAAHCRQQTSMKDALRCKMHAAGRQRVSADLGPAECCRAQTCMPAAQTLVWCLVSGCASTGWPLPAWAVCGGRNRGCTAGTAAVRVQAKVPHTCTAWPPTTMLAPWSVPRTGLNCAAPFRAGRPPAGVRQEALSQTALHKRTASALTAPWGLPHQPVSTAHTHRHTALFCAHM